MLQCHIAPVISQLVREVRLFNISVRFNRDGTGRFDAKAHSADTGDNITIRQLFFSNKDGQFLYAVPPTLPDGWSVKPPIDDQEVPQRRDQHSEDPNAYLHFPFSYPKELFPHVPEVCLYVLS